MSWNVLRPWTRQRFPQFAVAIKQTMCRRPSASHAQAITDPVRQDGVASEVVHVPSKKTRHRFMRL